MQPSFPPPQTPFAALVQTVAARAVEADVFAAVEPGPHGLRCQARDAGAPAFYSLVSSEGRVWVCLQTADRWLSQSIEQDLVHTGDKMDELVEEEMVDLGYSGPRLRVEHFRSEDKLFTFRSPLPAELSTSADAAALALLGYEACFRRLGDMEGGDDE